MVLLLDTNIILDVLMKREPHTELADRIITLCIEKKCIGYIAFHSIPTVYYVMRKNEFAHDRDALIYDLLKILDIAGASKTAVMNALHNEDFSDFEDCLQTECAKTVHADYIVTRNVSHFKNSSIPAVSPEVFLETILQEVRHA